MANKVMLSNLVEEKALRKVQLETLEKINSVISKTAGPFGSTSMIMHQDRLTEYSKDGHKVLSNFKFYRPLEQAIHDELLGITEYVISKVGDGTTTAVQLSYMIFNAMYSNSVWSESFSPYEIISTFQKVVNVIIERIKGRRREFSIDDVRQICLISTNGNEQVSDDIANIYETIGKDVYIKVGTSNTTSSIQKTYDGVILNKGYSSPAFINRPDNTCVIPQPRIYYFPDPVDTPEMIQMFMQIFTDNIYAPLQTREGDIVPTIIMAPALSKDMESSLETVEQLMYQYNQANRIEDKPPFCIITGINDRVDNIGDITKLCGCPLIKKYINPDQRVKDINEGVAPSPATVTTFYGSADEVTIYADKMVIINPKDMFDKDAPIAEDGSRPYSGTYNAIVSFLEKHIEMLSEDKTNLNALIEAKKRLYSLTANFVEYNIGGVAAADRDNIRDLVEDAVLNCRSAAVNGVGYGACIEGYLATEDSDIDVGSPAKSIKALASEMCNMINNCYRHIMEELYASGMPYELVDVTIRDCIEKKKAYNMREHSFDKNQVLCSIETDIAILEAISKIITIMYTTNQAFLVDPMQNAYLETDDDNN